MSLGTINTDYSSFYSVLKGNYRKGVHRFRTMLGNPDLAEDFANNLGSVSVVLGWPIGHDDKNSQELLKLLLESEVITQATLTWLGQWYPESNSDADTMYGDAARCQALVNDPLLWRAVGGDPVGAGKLIATLAGLDLADYDDMAAVARDADTMQAILATPTALNAMVSSPVAVSVVISTPAALSALAASQAAMQAVIGNAAALQTVVASQTAMTAVVASSTAMAAVAGSSTAMQAVIANSTALNKVVSSQTAMAAVAASSTAMTAVAASSTAMTAVGSSATARSAVAASTVAMNAICASSMATAKYATGAAGLNPGSYADMTAVAASSTAMTAVVSSTTAMQAVANSQTALNALAASTTALDALYAKKKRMSGASKALSGKFIILEISSDNAFNTSQYGYATLSDGSKPNWNNYLGKYAYFKQYKKVATYMKNDTDSNDWIDYFQIA